MLAARQTLRNASKMLPRANFMSANAGSLVDVAVDDGGTALVTMQRPPVNSLNLEMLQALGNAFDEVEKNKCKAMILTSASPTVFSAGLDITEMCKPDMKRLDMFWTALQDVWLKLYGATFITASAINGHAPAGGCLLAISCEYRIMVDGKYSIGLNESALGLLVPRFFMDTMCGIVHIRQAEMALTSGKLFSVGEALKVGLIDEVATDRDDAIEKCRRFIKLFDKVSPMARSYTKQGLRDPAVQWLLKNRQQDKEEFMSTVLKPEVQKIIEMYLENLKKKRTK